jgi:hypothetical protein
MIKNVYVFLWGVKASCIKLIALGVYYGHFLIFSQVALVLLYNLLDLSFFFFKKSIPIFNSRAFTLHITLW